MKINLLRREFLKKAGVVGIVTMTTPQVFAQKHAANATSSGNAGFLNKIDKQTYSLQTLVGKQLQLSYEAALIQWQQSGYQAAGSNYYVCQHRDLALFPLHLHHESLGLLDQAILCFERNKVGKWVKLRTLSGFDLEALAQAATALVKDNPGINLCDYLLPYSSSMHEAPFCFHTGKGEVSIKTLLSDRGSTSEVWVKEGNTTLFKQIISSKHTLNCKQGC